jgi:hypothetical protein
MVSSSQSGGGNRNARPPVFEDLKDALFGFFQGFPPPPFLFRTVPRLGASLL